MDPGLRQRVRAGETALGVFIKTPSHQVAEVLARSGLDFAVIDAEHAPFDAPSVDRVLLGARATGLPCLVRPPDLTASFIGQCLDLGAAGILAPHVANPDSAHLVVSAVKYGAGERGFSPSTRAAGYGAGSAATYPASADAESSIWCQIEDAEALGRLDDIAAIDAVDCLFLGRADLALALGAEGPNDPKVRAAVVATVEAGRRRGRAIGIYVGGSAEIPDLLALGITVFVCGSDQSLLLAQGRRIRADFGRTSGETGR
jgi:2-keto-3-deoxy-L-rhamnonate aldolase RhmA